MTPSTRLDTIGGMPSICPIPAFKDNYIWMILDGAVPSLGGELLHRNSLRQSGARRCAVVDPGDAAPVLALLGAAGLELAALLITHHHPDHVGGVAALTRQWPCPVYGPAAEPIAGVTRPVRDGDHISLPEGLGEWHVMAVPGHTAGHVAYVGEQALFCGDTLFGAGCGRLLGGSASQLFASLEKIAALPTTTRVYCAHEYTLANLAFAAHVEPDNGAVATRLAACRQRRSAGLATLPSTLEEELATNPFLRCAQPTIQRAASEHSGRALNDPEQVFAELRRWKDNF